MHPWYPNYGPYIIAFYSKKNHGSLEKWLIKIQCKKCTRWAWNILSKGKMLSKFTIILSKWFRSQIDMSTDGKIWTVTMGLIPAAGESWNTCKCRHSSGFLKRREERRKDNLLFEYAKEPPVSLKNSKKLHINQASILSFHVNCVI